MRPLVALALLAVSSLPAVPAAPLTMAGADTLSAPTAEAALLAADRAFARAVADAPPERRGAVWAGWFAADGRQILPGRVVTGREAIQALMDPAFRAPGYALEWDPDLAQAAADGSAGWTSGRYVSTRQGPDGPLEAAGRYVTFWQRQPDGSWRVTLDTGVADGP